MNVGWVFPFDKKCGIARYSDDYIDKISATIPILHINPQWWFTNKFKIIEKLKRCSLLHVQYDTAIFMKRRCDAYRAIIKEAHIPVIVSLHEVYDEYPGVFPRSQLTGIFPLLQLRQFIWDWRHPIQYNHSHHIKHNFYAQKIVVHHHYHTEILTRKGINRSLIEVIPLPVKKMAPFKLFNFQKKISLGAMGFINPSYNYDLLFFTLKQLRIPWTFTWIGGIRTDEQLPLYTTIISRIEKEGWKDRFLITGWVSEERMVSELNKIDIALALFKQRSSSASLARMMGAGKAIIASELPLTKEIAAFHKPGLKEGEASPPLLLTKADAESIQGVIHNLIGDKVMQQNVFNALTKYVEANALNRMSKRVVELYRTMGIQ